MLPTLIIASTGFLFGVELTWVLHHLAVRRSLDTTTIVWSRDDQANFEDAVAALYPKPRTDTNPRDAYYEQLQRHEEAIARELDWS